MKAIKFDGALKFVDDAPVRRREGEALIQVLSAGICNTDLEIVKGYAGFHGILGHEFVGRVVESDDARLTGRRVVGEINVGCNECDLCSEGDSRHCRRRTVIGIKDRDGAFAEFISLPVRNLVSVPDALPDEAAVFAEPLAAACQILEQVSINSSSSVAIIGDGKLAQAVIRVIAQTGCKPTVIGKHEHKLELASSAGALCLQINGTIDDLAGLVDDLKKPDVVIEASGSPTGLPLALGLVKPRGIIVLKSTHHAETALALSQVVVNEVTIVGSRCGRLISAIELLASGKVDMSPLISAQLPLDEGLKAFEMAGSPDTMKVLLRVAR
ncbi:MAG TPA: alcohol dehydrogenase catalytic domain-containing protein [Blastocatellia bacterium]|nr:alcohol dehydrogenase catalytic domain-containing protein [Blastocatellia bacterium]